MEKNKISTYSYNAIVILCIVCGAVYAASQFMYFGGGEVTDNARVCQNIVPQNCRVQGFIREVRFTEFQEVKKGDTLVVIEDAEFRLRLAQAEADLARAGSGRSRSCPCRAWFAGYSKQHPYHQDQYQRDRSRH